MPGEGKGQLVVVFGRGPASISDAPSSSVYSVC